MHVQDATVLIVAGRSATVRGQDASVSVLAASISGLGATVLIVDGHSAILGTVAGNVSVVFLPPCTLLSLFISSRTLFYVYN